MFIVATIKYACLLNKIPQPKLLKRKIIIDLVGVSGCALILGGILAGYTELSLWTLAVSFLIANFFLLIVWPMYRLDK
jgi:hypothetical protein